MERKWTACSGSKYISDGRTRSYYRDEKDGVVRPMPQVKLRLTEHLLLYQIVQLLLTYEPSIVQRVAILLFHVIQDNPCLRLYLLGAFFFILMEHENMRNEKMELAMENADLKTELDEANAELAALKRTLTSNEPGSYHVMTRSRSRKKISKPVH